MIHTDAKSLMTAAAIATLRGDPDAVEKTEAALVALEEERRQEFPTPAPLQTTACNCAQALAEIEGRP